MYYLPATWHQRTFAEMDRGEKNKLSHRFKAFREFKSFREVDNDWVVMHLTTGDVR